MSAGSPGGGLDADQAPGHKPTWGIISDVHGNFPALERAIELCRGFGAVRFAFLGDLLGRGDSDACVALIRATANLSVVGNRDLDWQHRVSAESREYVLGLPRIARADHFIAVHGDERLCREISSSEIRRGFGRTRQTLVRERARVALFGHTHQARVWRLPADGGPSDLLYDGADAPREPATLALAEPATLYAMNVGSTGLPFGGKGPASCAVYDVERRRLQIIPL